MQFVTFSENEKIHIAKIDKQHDALAKLINSVYASFISNKRRMLETSLKALLDLLRIHFDAEEKLMLQTKYIGYYSHKLEHDRFFNKINDFICGKLPLTSTEVDNIKKWFYNHIEISDKKCGDHFVKQGLT
jgi:hemerythrin